jgi:drug/metabolite transporter (DMT)-like permease
MSATSRTEPDAPRLAGGAVAGAALALVTAALYATQEPLSGPAAKALSAAQFILLTQAALLLATPLLILRRDPRRDFVTILSSAKGRWRLAALTSLGLIGLGLYNVGLSGAHPVVITAILNLSPFWAALAARAVLGKRTPVGVFVFVAALAGAFAGSLLVALSQSDASSGVAGLLKGTWYFAIPVPLFTALSATLVGVWFKDYDQGAAVAAALFVPPLVVLPACAVYLAMSGQGFAVDPLAAAMLVVGTMIAAALGRFVYQLALQATNGDNGFVTMFFLLSPALSGLYSWALSPFVKSLSFSSNRLYFLGLAVTAGSLLLFLQKARAKAATK